MGMQVDIGKNIRALRLGKGVTQEVLAAHLGVTFQAVSKWETGATIPDVLLLPDIAVYFGVTIDALFSLPDEARLARIENMLDDLRALSKEQYEQSESYLQGVLAVNPDNDRASWLLASVYLKQAQTLREKAIEYAKNALSLAPNDKAYNTALVEAMDGAVGDYYVNRRYALIAYYQDLLAKHPEAARAYLYAFDQLFHDNRLDEAEAVLAAHRAIAPRHVCHLFYAGDLLYARGDTEAAIKLWRQGETDYDGPAWLGAISLAERMERLCRYDEALAGYRKASDLAEKPRYVDPQIAMAQIYEALGRYDDAIRAREEEIAIKQAEWGIVSGEAINAPTREIARLKQRAE